MAINESNKQILIRRLAKAGGQLFSVQKMVQDELYCIDVLNQLKAVQGAIDKIAQLILKEHLDTCFVDAVKRDDSQRVMDELWNLLKAESADTELGSQARKESGSQDQKVKKITGSIASSR
jgi:DNA-binding FrmR family transcriptional regulator